MYDLESELGVTVETYSAYLANNFNPGYILAVLQWCQQVEFKVIMESEGKGAEG